eukprot:CAMPEP_0184699612 /NCGR_PEP_ID=MMETSP0313-20130426/5828_1 /TAXON_ID=2792 /ORGANISM="Porphyridium aerugineum, Strain SAG 1380-2" /LENGTH=542 /DNA_ID=CAMNT_0027158731 /DNA_START=680 /DNA_END=2305 /DNA_ORIENTATION=-
MESESGSFSTKKPLRSPRTSPSAMESNLTSPLRRKSIIRETATPCATPNVRETMRTNRARRSVRFLLDPDRLGGAGSSSGPNQSSMDSPSRYNPSPYRRRSSPSPDISSCFTLDGATYFPGSFGPSPPKLQPSMASKRGGFFSGNSSSTNTNGNAGASRFQVSVPSNLSLESNMYETAYPGCGVKRKVNPRYSAMSCDGYEDAMTMDNYRSAKRYLTMQLSSDLQALNLKDSDLKEPAPTSDRNGKTSPFAFGAMSGNGNSGVWAEQAESSDDDDDHDRDAYEDEDDPLLLGRGTNVVSVGLGMGVGLGVGMGMSMGLDSDPDDDSDQNLSGSHGSAGSGGNSSGSVGELFSRSVLECHGSLAGNSSRAKRNPRASSLDHVVIKNRGPLWRHRASLDDGCIRNHASSQFYYFDKNENISNISVLEEDDEMGGIGNRNRNRNGNGNGNGSRNRKLGNERRPSSDDEAEYNHSSGGGNNSSSNHQALVVYQGPSTSGVEKTRYLQMHEKFDFEPNLKAIDLLLKSQERHWTSHYMNNREEAGSR